MRYVVLHHTECESPHFDLLIETDSEALLSSWRLLNWPPGVQEIAAQRPPHRRFYLEYEGGLSDGRGRVDRVAAGQYEWLAEKSSGGYNCLRLGVWIVQVESD